MFPNLVSNLPLAAFDYLLFPQTHSPSVITHHYYRVSELVFSALLEQFIAEKIAETSEEDLLPTNMIQQHVEELLEIISKPIPQEKLINAPTIGKTIEAVKKYAEEIDLGYPVRTIILYFEHISELLFKSLLYSQILYIYADPDQVISFNTTIISFLKVSKLQMAEIIK